MRDAVDFQYETKYILQLLEAGSTKEIKPENIHSYLRTQVASAKVAKQMKYAWGFQHAADKWLEGDRLAAALIIEGLLN
jgi:predicted NACHT family NTPase